MNECSERTRSRPWWLGVAGALARHPTLWATAIVQVARLAAPGWWRRRPFVPLPGPAYLRFRLETQYGDDRGPEAVPEPADVIAYLRWCRRFPRPGGAGPQTRSERGRGAARG